ncbi:hypothetical protein TNIN_428931 [Trichonephila inaurata madagascariensis]|uniref:Uncharacterized protein n=1 Tax=Trichonephila inaurata madagascariensis TaxID=2747483 RepID=A0A8X6JDQ0_9ARAC|nr:hypothetical protein TNIN_428931 [Trichonephila inaurata madagascariensis]
MHICASKRFLGNKSNFWCKAKRENYWSESLADPFNSDLSAAEVQFLGVRFTCDVIGRLALPNFTVLSLPVFKSPLFFLLKS